MTEHLMIDGNNLLHIMHEQSMGPPVARMHLARLIADFAVATGIEVTIVFDGPAPLGGLARQFDMLKTDIRFSAPVPADDIIIQAIQRRARDDVLRVITSDRAIQAVARMNHCPFEDAATFAGRLLEWDTRRRSGFSPSAAVTDATTEPEKPDDVDERELNRYLRELGNDLDDLPPMWQI